MVSKQPLAGQLTGRLEAEGRLGGSGLAWMLGLEGNGSWARGGIGVMDE
jgi:hypothetical protein